MKEIVKGIVLVIFGLVLAFVGVYLVQHQFINYGIIVLALTFAYILFCISYFVSRGNPEKTYEIKVNNILRTYDSILARGKDVPNLDNRNIIILDRIDDMINIQTELRKPVFYIKQVESCSFVILDDKEAYIYIEKLNSNVKSPVEIEIENAKRKLGREDVIDEKILTEIEKTTIVKLPNRKYYKVSPIRDNKDKKDDNIEVMTENKEEESNNIELPVVEEDKKEEVKVEEVKKEEKKVEEKKEEPKKKYKYSKPLLHRIIVDKDGNEKVDEVEELI